MHLCTILHPLILVFFYSKCVCTVTVPGVFNIFTFFGSVGYVRERGSKWENNKKL